MDLLSGRFSESDTYVTSASGAWLTTATGKLTDYLLGNCSQLLGHCHPRVVDAVREQVGRSVNVGDNRHHEAYRLAERITRLAGKDAIRLVNSGSEAVHCALRAARAATGRQLVLKFEGHYHGWFSEEISRFVPDLEYASGLPDDAGERMIVVEWNDRAAVQDVIARYGDRLAAVLCEPMLCHAGPVPADEGFLAFLREQATGAGALLVFDECITGFRLAPGGAQERFGVTADLVTYSKAVSAGFPIGICAGTAEAMTPLATGVAYQAATYDANSVSVAAAHAVLDVLETEPVYQRIAEHGTQLQQFMAAELERKGVPAVCQGDTSVFQFFFTDSPVRTHAQALATDTELYGHLVQELQARGVNIFKGDLRPNPRASWLSQWFVSAAHDQQALEWTTDAYPKALDAALRLRGAAA